MEDNFIKLEINDDEYLFDYSYTIFQACEKIGITIPRFCYHDRLKIAGNCRVCFIEEIKSTKPIISCATVINEGNEIFTQSELALDGRESVIEYLLINHPLDCPIRDQGGERDLQDQTLIYGSDAGRYYEYKKRSVENKNYTPLIKFFLNRCIHCARCTRFSHDISSSFLLSILGRGFFSEISSYVNTKFVDELSGNIIDLCPVGALTSKPYAFISRIWEVVDYKTIDIFDSLNSLIKVEYRGLSIIRVLPVINDLINEEWISDKIRFNYDAYNKMRVLGCMLIINNRFYYYSWLNSIYFYKSYFYNNILNLKKQNKKFFLTSNLNKQFIDLFFSINLKRFLLTTNFIFNNQISCNNDLRLDFLPFNNLSDNIEGSNKKVTIFLANVNLRFESPVFNLRIKNLINISELGDSKILNFYSIGAFFNYTNYIDYFGNNQLIIFKKIFTLIFKNKILSSSWENFYYWIFSNNISTTADAYIYDYFRYIKNIFSNIHFNVLFVSTNSSVLLLKEAGLPEENIINKWLYFNKFKLISNFMTNEAYYYINKYALKCFFGHHFADFVKNYNLIFPTKLFIEKPISYINLDGYLNTIDLVGFDYKYSAIKKEGEIIDILGRLFSIKNYTDNSEKLYKINKIFPYFENTFKNTFVYKLIINDLFKNLAPYRYSSLLNFFNLKSYINDFYVFDIVSRCSSTMSICSKRFTLLNDFLYLFYNINFFKN